MKRTGIGSVLIGLAVVRGLISGAVFSPRSAVGQSQDPMHVVYFASESASSGQLSPTSLATSMASKFPLVSYDQQGSWSGVLSSHANDPIDVLITDKGSIGEVDPAWVQDRYMNQAMALLGIDVPVQVLATIANDPITTHSSLSFSPSTRERYSGLQIALKGNAAYMAVATANFAAAIDDDLDYPEGSRGYNRHKRSYIYVDRDGADPFYEDLWSSLDIKHHFDTWK